MKAKHELGVVGAPRGVALSLSIALVVGVVAFVTWIPAGQGRAQAACVEPTPTASPTESPIPEPSPTSTADPTERMVTLTASREMVRTGGTVNMTAVVAAADGTCLPDALVRISGATLGSGTECRGRQGRTNELGEFVSPVKVGASCEFTAVAPETKDGQPEVASEPVIVRAKVYVTARTRTLAPERGSKVEITAQVKPPHPGSMAALERKKKDGGWRKVMEDKANATGFKFKLRAKWKGKRVFRVTWIKSDEDHEPASSNWLKIKTRPPRDGGGRRGGRG